MNNYLCGCPQCAGGEPFEDTRLNEPEYCVQCGGPLWPDDEVVSCPDGLLHGACVAEYIFTDATREELLEFAETVTPEFIRFMSDTRNLRAGGGAA
ncbi:MAG: hypothetical protein LBR85_04225 [Oscillospiraceae bacterium]|jgi:hypothetical protein|nr:hypothetical protein [Oscillospiraceae bacterium]